MQHDHRSRVVRTGGTVSTDVVCESSPSFAATARSHTVRPAGGADPTQTPETTEKVIEPVESPKHWASIWFVILMVIGGQAEQGGTIPGPGIVNIEPELSTT